MIEGSETSAAIAAASTALDREGFSWIKQSALTERAYFLGLYNGLSAIAPESQLASLGVRIVVNTMFKRAGDKAGDTT